MEVRRNRRWLVRLASADSSYTPGGTRERGFSLCGPCTMASSRLGKAAAAMYQIWLIVQKRQVSNMVRSLGTLIGQSIVTSCHSAQAEQILSRWQGSCLFMMHRSPAVLVCVLALLAMGQVCEAHMTEFCLSRLPSTSTTDNFRLLIEHCACPPPVCI